MRHSRSIVRSLACAAAFLFAVATAQAQGVRLRPHEKIVLKNGLTVLLLQKHGIPLFSVEAIVKAGAAADPAGQAGLANVTASLLRKGTRTRTAQQFAADLDFTGGSFDSGASSDFSVVTAEFMTKDTAIGLELFTDALLHPVFPQAEVDKLLAQGIDGIKAAKDDPESVLATYFNGYLYGTAPYGRPENGDEISLKSINRDAVVKFYDSHYAPGNTILAVAGEFDPAEMKARLEQNFGAWPAKAVPATSLDPATPAKGKRLLLIDKPDASQTYFAVGDIGIAATDPDRVAIRVVNTIFGGSFTSMLNETLRVKSGLSYGAGSYFDSRQQPGPFVMESFTKNETTAKAIDLALEELAKLHQDGVTPEQLASAKNYLKGQFPPTVETSAQLAHRIALDEFRGFDDSEVNDFAARVDAVTPEVARRVIAKHFPSENLVFVLIGKASEIAPVIAKYAAQRDERAISAPGFWPAAK